MLLPNLQDPSGGWVAIEPSHLPDWRRCRRIAIDIETHDPTLAQLGPGVRRHGYICGVSFAVESGDAYYLPLRHADGNLPLAPALGYLMYQAQHFAGDVVGASLQYDLDFLHESGIMFDTQKVNFRDIQIAESLLNEFRPSYSLASIASYYGMMPKDESLLVDTAKLLQVDPKKGMSRLPAWAVAKYAMRDVQLPLAIYREQEQLLHAEGLDETWAMECNLLPILLRMRRRGVAVDLQVLDRIEAETQHTLTRLAAEIAPDAVSLRSGELPSAGRGEADSAAPGCAYPVHRQRGHCRRQPSRGPAPGGGAQVDNNEECLHCVPSQARSEWPHPYQFSAVPSQSFRL